MNSPKSVHTILRNIIEIGRKSLDFLFYLVLLLAFSVGIYLIYGFTKETFNRYHTYEYKIYTSDTLMVKDEIRSDIEKESLGRSIDLINLLIVACGGFIALVSIFIVLQIRRWESQHEEAKTNLIEAQEKLEDAQTKVEDVDQIVKMLEKGFNEKIIENIKILDEIFTHFSRGLSKFHSNNFTAAIGEFQKLLDIIEKEIKPKISSENFESFKFSISDIYFLMARSYFKNITYDEIAFDDIVWENLTKVIEFSEKAIIEFEKEDARSNKAYVMAYCAIALAYKTNPNINLMENSRTEEERIGFKKQALSLVEEAQQISRDSIYNIACTYSVLYTYETDENEKEQLLEKALHYLKQSFDERIITKNYILEDPDLKHLIDPLPPYKDDDEKRPRKRLEKIIGPNFKKKDARYQLSKLYMDMYMDLETDKGKKEHYLDVALDILDRCKSCGIVTEEQIIHSKYWSKHKEILEKENIISNNHS